MHAPIGIFDSGLGGLTVLRALLAQLPAEDYLYLADTRHLPYGDKPEIFLRERGKQIAAELVTRGCKAIVIACNTATAAAAEAIRAQVTLPVVALEPGVKPAVQLSQRGRIGVLATRGTLASERFRRLVSEYGGNCDVLVQECNGLAEAIEQHGPDSPEVGRLLDQYLPPLAGADQVVLGCTHYPWVRSAIQQRLPEAALIDTGEAIARQLGRLLEANGHQGGGCGHIQVLTTGQAQQARHILPMLWGDTLPIQSIAL